MRITDLDAERGGGNEREILVDSTAPLTFKERAGKSGGGKGLLIQEDRAGTISSTQNQGVLTEGRKEGRKEGSGDKPDNSGNAGEAGGQDAGCSADSRQELFGFRFGKSSKSNIGLTREGTPTIPVNCDLTVLTSRKNE